MAPRGVAAPDLVADGHAHVSRATFVAVLVVFALALLAGLYFQNRNVERDQAEVSRAQNAECAILRETRLVLRDLIRGSSAPLPTPEGADPVLVETIRVANDLAAKNRAEMLHRIDSIPGCAAG